MNRHQIRTSLGPSYSMKSDREIDRIVLAVLEGVRGGSDKAAYAGSVAFFEGPLDDRPTEAARLAFTASIDALIAQVKEGEDA